MTKSSKTPDSKLAEIAATFKRKTGATRSNAPTKRTDEKPANAQLKAASEEDEPTDQMTIRVSPTLVTHANHLAIHLRKAVRAHTKDSTIDIAPNKVMLIALLRWQEVTMKDRDEIVRHGQDKEQKTASPMWLPVTQRVSNHMANLQEQFVSRGVPIAKVGCNEPAIAREAVWRWKEVTQADVDFYLSLPPAYR